MDYGEFDAARRRIVRAWGTEITDPEVLAEAVERLREQAETVEGEADRAKAIRYLKTMDDLVVEARTPESAPIRQASDVMMRASSPEGTPAERRARARAGMEEIARIAYAAPTTGERDAALEMNETLASIIEMIDAESEEP
ncbi:hypothetical protein [Kribbella shirazensis]|uniref:Uncharacterized protein n=1 Tax=Kribbella shirazensis TaxID=1105143 RepID=A0A7X5VJ48_9ACTN|nr:hypothetical protein [Kribbella shirazensis]NIK62187.1 hypothetical protein [Kribbella shirazensis]